MSGLQGLTGLLPAPLLKRIAALQFSNPVFRWAIEQGSNRLRHKDLVMKHGVGAGLRFNTGASNVGYALGTTEPDVQNAIAAQLRPGDVFYDIGAHVGFFTVLGARLVGEGGRVVAFEPLPANVGPLEHNVTLNAFKHVRVVAAAVAGSAGKAALQLVGNTTGPKLASAGLHPDSKGMIEVETLKLDDWVQAEGERAPTFLKIDVEGAELEVIEGMRELIVRHHPVILCEMHGKNREYAALMSSLGYEVRTLLTQEGIEEAHWNCHTLATPVPAHAPAPSP